MASSEPNKKFPLQRGFPTPNEAPGIESCRVFSIPADEEWLALLMGAVSELTNPYNWFRNGSLTQQESADAFADIMDEAYAQAETGTCSVTIDAPFWDNATDVDDEVLVIDQIWYGALTYTP